MGADASSYHGCDIIVIIFAVQAALASALVLLLSTMHCSAVVKKKQALQAAQGLL